jgi:hypothetical protein
VIRRASVALCTLVPLMTLAMSCQPPRHTSAAGAGADSLTGIVSITGTGFEQRIVLRSGDSVTYLSAATPDSAALSRIGGVEVRVTGRRTPSLFRVEHFTALSVAGAPVTDGVLRNDGGRLVLETVHGRIPLGNPPAALRSLVDARVWIGGPLDRGPNSYGLIVPPP